MSRGEIQILMILFFIFNAFLIWGQNKEQDLMNINSISPKDYKIFYPEDDALSKNQYSITDYSSLKMEVGKLPNENESSIFWMIINNKTNVTKKVLEIYAPNLEDIKVMGVNYRNLLTSQIKILPIKAQRNGFYYFFVDKKTDLFLIGNSTKAFKNYKIELHDEMRFLKKQTALNVFLGIALGIFIVLFLYHLILYIKVKDKLYLYYVFYIAIIGLVANQYTFRLLQDCIFCKLLFYLTFYYYSLWFSSKILILKPGDRKYFIYTGILVLCSLLFSLLYNRNLPKYTILLSGILVFTMISIVAYFRFPQSCKFAKWFILPWGTLLIVYVALLVVDKLMPLLEIGLVLHAGLLSMAIANKLYEYKVAKTYAESNEIKALSERDRVIYEQNKALKELIDIRNKEIIERNTDLQKQQKEIKDKTQIIVNTNNWLNTINEKLYLKNHEITSQNNELQKHKELLEIIIRKRTKKLIVARERAEVAEKLKANFLSNLTNEIRIPMNAITGFASMLNSSGLSKENRNNFLDKIEKNVDILLATIDNIVLLARIQSGIFKPKIKPFTLGELLSGCLEHYKNKVSFDNRNLNILLEESKLPYDTIIKSDYTKLRLIINHLMDNALKFSEEGCITISSNIYIDNTKKDYNSSLLLSISDNGIGIEKEKLEFIFERFAKIENDKTKLYYGAGMGLAIVKGIVDLFHGKILVESKLGVGTKFSVTVPVQV